MKKFILILCFVVGTCVPLSATAQSFADQLYVSGAYQNALVEYLRYQFETPTDSLSSFWHFRQGMCWYQLEEYSKALELFQSINDSSQWKDSSTIRSAECLLLTGNINSAQNVLRSEKRLHPLLLSAVVNVYDGKLIDAQKTLDSLAGTDDSIRTRQCTDICRKLSTLQLKNYWVAGGASIIPGLGHVYAERPKDGLFNALVIGVCAAATGYYAYFNERNRALAIGSVGAVFYLGNIYGALSAVSVYNNDKPAILKKRLWAVYEER